MAPTPRSRTPEEIQASLAPPGAGIPMPMRVVLRLLVKPLRIRPTTWEANEEQFLKAHRRLADELRSFPKDRLTERVLVPRQRGLEDSSRYWSAAMVARHLTIVDSKMEQVISALSRGEKVTEVADTAKVKPETERNEVSAVTEYLAFGDGVVERLRKSVQDRSSPSLHNHPWFGAMTAKDWFWLLGMHTSLHRHQLKNIRKGLLPL